MYRILKEFQNTKLFDLDLKKGHKIYKPEVTVNRVDTYSIYKISTTKSYLIYFLRCVNVNNYLFCPFDGNDDRYLYHTLEEAERALHFTHITNDKTLLGDLTNPYVPEYIEAYPERVI